MVKDFYETSTSIWGTWHSSDASSGLDKPKLVLTYGTPVAYSYGFDADGIDSTGTADEAYYLFDNLGYTRYKYYASAASYVRNGFAERAITFISSHGGAGRICIYDSAETKTRLSGDTSSDPIAYSLEYRYSSGNYTMDPSRLIVFAGCHTASNDATYGNLLERAAEYGADCAVGFEDSIYIGSNSSEVFANALFDELNNEDNISTALYDAKFAVYYHNDQHNYYGYDSYIYDGAVSSPGLVTVKPAQYGQ